jgi:spore coat protein CotF
MKPLEDKEILTDMLAAQKQETNHYNLFACECANMDLKNETLKILHDEQNMQSAVFCEMQKRGWYPTCPAPQKQVDQARTKFEGMAQQMMA